MKSFTFLLLAILFTFSASAQKPFALLYKSQWPVDCKWRLSNDAKTLALGGDLEAIAMLDATNGKLLWEINFKDKLGVKKAIDWTWDENKGLVIVQVKGATKDQTLTVWFDEKTGEKLDDLTTRNSKEKVKYIPVKRVKDSGMRYKGSIDNEEKNIHLKLLYKSKIATSSGGKGTKVQISVESTGAYAWTSNFEGKILRALCDNAVGNGYSGDFITMELHGNQIFVIYEGISVFDLITGKKLWETTFDNIDFSFGLMKSTQILGKAAMPVIGDDGIYIADLSRGVHRIKKLNSENGTLIWESEEFDKDNIIPDMGLVGNTLIAKFGGEIETQTYIPGSNGNADVCKDEYKMHGAFGIKAFDATTGKLIWETEKNKALGDKFSGSLSNISIEGNNVICCTSKNMLCIEIASGKLIWKTDISKTGIGMVSYIWERDGAYIASGAKGVASIDLASGKLNWATKTKKNLGTFGTPDAYFMWVGKSFTDYQDFIRIDLNTGKILGIQKGTRYPQWTNDYEEFLKYDGKKIFRYKTRP